MTGTDPLLLTRDGAVATLTINRPERLNALSYAMFTQLPKLLEETSAMPGIRALVLRGAGTRAFSAGADISEFETARMTREPARLVAVLLADVTSSPKHGVRKVSIMHAGVQITHAALDASRTGIDDRGHGLPWRPAAAPGRLPRQRGT